MTQHQAGSAGVAFGAMPATKAKLSKRKADKKEDKRQHRERALDEGLEETFPASDAVSLTEPAAMPPDDDRK